MKARALILTIGTTLALIAPAAQSASAGNALGCDYLATHALSDRGTGPNPFWAQVQRNLQAVAIGQSAATSRPNRTTCGLKTKTTTVVAPNHFQVLRNSAL
jgi:hypothetical protein